MLPDALGQLRAWWRKRNAPARRGERAAARHLKRRGLRLLGRNVRSRLGEIDLLAEDRKSGAIVLVEVKTTSDDRPPPEAHVDPAKQRKLTQLAGQLMRRHGWNDRTVRFDVVGVVWPAGAKRPTRLTHHKNAFEAAFG